MRRSLLVLGLATAAILSNAAVAPATSAHNVISTTHGTRAGDTTAPGARDVPVRDRVRVLGPAWRRSADRAVTVAGDSTGLHVLVAEETSGYAWRTATTLREPDTEVDQWIGQACTTASGRRAVVVYAPRQAVNHEQGMHRGGLVAIVDLVTGSTRKLPLRASLAYYNPGCGSGETAMLTSNHYSRGEYVSRLSTVNTVTGRIEETRDVRGQVTSAVPGKSEVVAVKGTTLVSVGARGSVRPLSRTAGVPFRLVTDPLGGVGYEVRTGTATELHRYAAGRDDTIGRFAKDSLQLRQSGGRVYVLGPDASPTGTQWPRQWRTRRIAPDSQLSTTGNLAITAVTNTPTGPGNRSLAVLPDAANPVTIRTTVLGTGAHPAFTVHPISGATSGAKLSPALVGRAPKAHATATDPSTVTTDPDRGCAIPRNDPKIQSLQPTPEMGEWAADLAVQGKLTIQRPAGWNGTSLPAYTPESLFPVTDASRGVRVPAQVLLGVMAQESNMWQAGRDVVDGESGNFEQGGFYGISGSLDFVNFNDVDCGYGATQVTTGMSVADGNSVYTPTQQLAIATDYAANTVAGLRILQSKWNEMKRYNVLANNADPAKIENWWFALWAYNSGWHAQSGSAPYGLGWSNNMANEDYPADRDGFLDDGYDDAKYPNHWSYPERVLGWATHPLLRLNWKTGEYGSAYRIGRWTNMPQRPLRGTFCNATNQCDMSQVHKPGDYPDDPGGPCLRDDLKCWWHQSITWADCADDCGNEQLIYAPGAAEPSASGETLYGPDCATSKLPSNALIVDDVAAPAATRNSCGKTWTNNGSLTFKFGADSAGHYPSKIDFHQLSTGFGNHFWYAHAWAYNGADPRHKITGTWTLNKPLTWARVLVYVPDHGAGTPQAAYTVNNSDSTSPKRTVTEGNYLDDNRNPAAGHWERLGVFHFTGTPSVSLDNQAHLGRDPNWQDGVRDVPWDAVAFQPLPGKPADQVVALGDSYASGEGASHDPVAGAWDYYRPTDHDGMTSDGDDPTLRDACHRSPYSWSRQSVLPGNTASIGTRADRYDPTLSYHMSACSGAVVANMRTSTGGQVVRGQYSEGSQLDQGYLDQYTTRVTLSIGGNDAFFSSILKQCILNFPGYCQDTTLDDNPGGPLKYTEPNQIKNVVRPAIEEILVEIQKKAPNAKVVLMGYPRLLENEGGCIAGIASAESDWLNGTADLLAEQMSAAASNAKKNSKVNVVFADPRNAFAGKAACGTPDRDIHALVFSTTRGDIDTYGPDISQQSFHPIIQGDALYADVANRAYQELGK